MCVCVLFEELFVVLVTVRAQVFKIDGRVLAHAVFACRLGW